MKYPIATVFAVLLASSEASAQSRGGLRVGVERMFGFSWSSVTNSTTTTVGSVTTTREQTTTWVSLNLLGTGAGTSPSTLSGLTPTPPRVTFDYELASRLTLGGSIFFSYNTLSIDDSGSDDSVDVVSFGLAPRVGYWLALGDTISFWPRVGATFGYTTSGTRLSSSRLTSLWLNVEPALVIEPVPRIGLTTTLVVDIPLLGDLTRSSTPSGSMTTVETTGLTLKQLSIGLQFGLLARF